MVLSATVNKLRLSCSGFTLVNKLAYKPAPSLRKREFEKKSDLTTSGFCVNTVEVYPKKIPPIKTNLPQLSFFAIIKTTRETHPWVNPALCKIITVFKGSFILK